MDRFYRVTSKETGNEYEFEGVEFFELIFADYLGLHTILEVEVDETIDLGDFTIKVMNNDEVHFYFVRQMLAGSEKMIKLLKLLTAPSAA